MPLPTLKRNLITAAIRAALDAIRAGDTYFTDLGLHGNTWRPKSKAFEKSELPGYNLRDVQSIVVQELTGGSTNLWLKRLTVEVDIPCKDITTLIKCFQDVYTAMAADHTLGGLAIDVNSAGDVVDVDEDEFTVAGGTVTLLVDYETSRMEV